MWDMIVGIFRSILFFFDQIIYGFIPAVYSFIKILAIQQIFNADALQRIANNIYAILGVFMLFRLAFVLLNAIVDPDKLTNKEKGFGKIMTRVVTALVLIVAIPYAFELAYGLQGQILEQSIVEKIVLGKTADGGSNYGQQMAKTSLKSFYSCNPQANGYSDDPENPGDCQIVLEEEYNLAFPTNDQNNNDVNFDFFATNLNQKVDGVYQYSYNAGLSTVAGIFILALLIMFTFDIGVRAVKLGFLQLITPVAVIGYIEPGGGIFKKWQDMCIKTYINLFIRILAISFVVLVISIISDTGTQFVDFNGDPLIGSTRTFVIIFIIIGALMFAKEAPKMLSSMFGLEEGSLGSLNPFKRLQGMAGAGLIGGLAAGGFKGIGGVVGGVSGGFAASSRGGSFLAGAGQGLKTGFSNIKMKDAIKGGVGGLGKSLWGGTIGAAGKGGSYAAGKVTGKEEKVGPLNWAKSKMAATAQEMHTGHAEEETYATGKKLRDQINTMAKRDDWSRGSKTAEQIARERAAAIKNVFSNKDFADSYEKSKIASGYLTDKKEALTELQNNLAVASSKYQAGDVSALSDITDLQGKIKKATKDVSDYEETATLYKNEFEELSKKDYNKSDVDNLKALETYDKTETAKKRIDQ